MKAIRVERWGAPEVLQLQTVADPAPAAGQVLVCLHAAGVNPFELAVRAGQYAKLPALPYTPGHDGAGVVEAVGAGVTGFAPGDRVYLAGSITGTYAELALAEAAQVHHLPDAATFQQGAALGVPYATAYRALFQRTQARAGETLLVHGATGGVGLAATQLARAAGLIVIGTGGSEEGRKLVTAQGARHVLDHHAPDYGDKLLALTGGRGVDLILEMLANVNLGRDLTLLAPHGRVVVIGSRGPVEINPRDAMGRDASILGMVLWNTPAADYAAIHMALQAGLASGALHPVVGHALPLAEAAQAHALITQPGALGKIVLTM